MVMIKQQLNPDIASLQVIPLPPSLYPNEYHIRISINISINVSINKYQPPVHY